MQRCAVELEFHRHVRVSILLNFQDNLAVPMRRSRIDRNPLIKFNLIIFYIIEEEKKFKNSIRVFLSFHATLRWSMRLSRFESSHNKVSHTVYVAPSFCFYWYKEHKKAKLHTIILRFFSLRQNDLRVHYLYMCAFERALRYVNFIKNSWSRTLLSNARNFRVWEGNL